MSESTGSRGSDYSEDHPSRSERKQSYVSDISRNSSVISHDDDDHDDATSIGSYASQASYISEAQSHSRSGSQHSRSTHTSSDNSSHLTDTKSKISRSRNHSHASTNSKISHHSNLSRRSSSSNNSKSSSSKSSASSVNSKKSSSKITDKKSTRSSKSSHSSNSSRSSKSSRNSENSSRRSKSVKEPDLSSVQEEDDEENEQGEEEDGDEYFDEENEIEEEEEEEEDLDDPDAEDDWTYQVLRRNRDKCFTPTRWGDLFPICDEGEMQSPIDIQHTSTKFISNLEPLLCNYKEIDLCKLVNTGKNLLIETEKDPSYSQLLGGPLSTSDDWRLLEIHFHWGSNKFDGSEHKINGMKYTGEIQYVHYNIAKYETFDDALGQEDGVCILSRFIRCPPKYQINKGRKAANLDRFTYDLLVWGFIL